MKTMQLCPACAKLLPDAYDLKKIKALSGVSWKKEPCDWCGKKVVLIDTFEVAKKRRP